MNKVLEYIILEEYNKAIETLEDRESRIIFATDSIKIKVKKYGKDIFNIIVTNGDKNFTEVAKDLLVYC